ncbi:MAG: energy transducer TonB [Treponema sp.]|nr:energy transducer TonB [Treponema sp.]
MNEKRTRYLIIFITAAVHILLIFFLAFESKRILNEPSELARVMKVTDLLDFSPPPPSETEIPQTENIAENIVETDYQPNQELITPGALNVHSFENYLLMHQVSFRPEFDESAILSELVYPPIALRSGIEGRVILELFVDRTGTVQLVTILREEPEGRGFGEAAVRAFMGKKGKPAYANGEPVSCRFRYPVTFRIR